LPEWQTSNLAWKPKEHGNGERDRNLTNEQLSTQLSEAAANDAHANINPNRAMTVVKPAAVATRRKRGLGHAAPFLPDRDTTEWSVPLGCRGCPCVCLTYSRGEAAMRWVPTLALSGLASTFQQARAILMCGIGPAAVPDWQYARTLTVGESGCDNQH